MRIISCNTGLRMLTLALSAVVLFCAACTATTPGDGRNTTRNGSLLGASDDSADPEADDPGGAESSSDSQGADAGTPDPDDPGGAAPDGGDPNADNVNRAGSSVEPGAADPGLPDEVQSTVDSDGDGFSDAIETSSSDPFYANLAANGANPYLPDIFVYIDYYYAPPNQGALDLVVQAFANAPLTNDFKGRGIALHVIMGKRIPKLEQVQNLSLVCPDDDDVAPDWSAFNTIKVNNFPEEWTKIAHYVLWADQIGERGTSGCSNGIPSHDLVVSLGTWGQYKDRDMVQAGTLMHELGHNLGLMHDGQYNLNNAPNYLSIMSYNYQSYGLPLDTGEFVLDYSRMPMGAVSEQGLNEMTAMSDSGLPHQPPYSSDLVNYRAIFGYQWEGRNLDYQMQQVHPVQGIVTGWLDFNSNGLEEGDIPPFDLDGNGMTTDVFPATWNDWEHLVYQGAEAGGGIIGDGEPETNPVYVVRLSPDEPLHELGHQ